MLALTPALSPKEREKRASALERLDRWLLFPARGQGIPMPMNPEEHPTSNIEWQWFQRPNYHFGISPGGEGQGEGGPTINWPGADRTFCSRRRLTLLRGT